MNTLQADQLACGYGGRAVLESLSLAARAAEVLVLLGPNGSGKTTLLRALARLLAPRHGAVFLDDRNLADFRAGELARRIALTPQTERRDWPLTVEESVRLGRAPHRGWLLPLTHQDHQIVEEALGRTGLVELRGRPITELSGGEWRRMIVARALAQEASVLLLDEPTAGLDLKYQFEVLRMVRELAKGKQLVVVLTLHDLNHASLFADRIAVLGERRLFALGSPAEVLTADLIGRAFGVQVTVTRHPVYDTPLVAPLADVPHRSPVT